MKRILYHLTAVTLLALATPAVADQSDDKETFVVIQAGRVITAAGEELVGSPNVPVQIVLVDGKIRLVGKDLDYPKTAKVIDARDQVVMPGMIHPGTRWQLPSYSRSGAHADRTVEKELYLEEIDFEPLLKAGFTAICYYPVGSGIPGTGVVYRTAGKTEDRQIGPAYVRVTMLNPGGDKKTLLGAITKARAELEKVEKAKKEWDEKQKKAKEDGAKEESKEGEKPAPEKKDEESPPGRTGAAAEDDKKETPEKKDGEADKKAEDKKPETFTPPKIDPGVKPLADWIRDKKGPPLLFELSRASDLHHLDDVLKRATELPGTLLFLSATYSPDFHHVVESLGERKALVLTYPRIDRLPSTVTRYNLPAELAAAGCTVAMLPMSDSTSELKNVRARLAELVRSGLSREDALKAVTINAAKVLGMDERLGSIEKGKDADVIFLDGDPLAVGTQVTRVMMRGEIVWEASE